MTRASAARVERRIARVAAPVAPPPPLPGWPANWHRIEAAVMARATPVALASRLHGPRHWRSVARIGVELAHRTPGADVEIVVQFALLHDSQRWHDAHDPGHGPRAATLARRLYAEGVLGLSPPRLALLTRAIERHADGEVSADPTVGAAWDSDRLDIERCGTSPDSRYLSRASAMESDFYNWARDLHPRDTTWAAIRARHEALAAAGGTLALPPVPRTGMREWLAEEGHRDPAGEAARLLRAARAGPEGGMEVVKVLDRMPPGCTRATALADLIEGGAHRRLLQFLFVQVWLQGSWRVVEAAGHVEGVDWQHPAARRRVVDWLRKIDYREPLSPRTRQLCDLSRLPERFTAWRGGTRSPGWTARGLSWSRDRPYAANQARAVWQRGYGSPILLKRETTRAEVLLHIDGRGPFPEQPSWDEIVLPPDLPGSELDTTDVAAIEALADEGEARLEKAREGRPSCA